MFYRTLASLSLIASAPLSANEIDTINGVINTAQSIRDTFKYGIQAVGGMANYAGIGGIAPKGTVDPGFITAQQALAYNEAILTFKNANLTVNANADDYFQQQAEQSMNNVSAAVDAYVQAATAVVTVVTVQEMAVDAAQSASEDNNEAAVAVQEYIEANDVLLEETEVDGYNDALTNMEETAQTAAAFVAIANDPTLLEEANTQAEDMQVTYEEVSDAFFDATSGVMTIAFVDQDTTVTLQLNSYFKTNTDIMNEGANSYFYRSSPEGGCYFIEDPAEREVCVNAG